MEANYTSEHFQTNDNIVIPQDELYSKTWETESNHLILEPLVNYRGSQKVENTFSRRSVTQQNIDSEQQSVTHSSKISSMFGNLV